MLTDMIAITIELRCTPTSKIWNYKMKKMKSEKMCLRTNEIWSVWSIQIGEHSNGNLDLGGLLFWFWFLSCSIFIFIFCFSVDISYNRYMKCMLSTESIKSLARMRWQVLKRNSFSRSSDPEINLQLLKTLQESYCSVASLCFTRFAFLCLLPMRHQTQSLISCYWSHFKPQINLLCTNLSTTSLVRIPPAWMNF